MLSNLTSWLNGVSFNCCCSCFVAAAAVFIVVAAAAAVIVGRGRRSKLEKNRVGGLISEHYSYRCDGFLPCPWLCSSLGKDVAEHMFGTVWFECGSYNSMEVTLQMLQNTKVKH